MNKEIIINENTGVQYDTLTLFGMMCHACDLLREQEFNPNPITHVGLSNRMTKTLAATHRKGGTYWIIFNSKFLKVADDSSIREVVIHEAVHLIDGCFNHGKKFKQVADIMNARYGFHISRCTSDEAYHEQRIQMRSEKPHWILKCPTCGHIYGPYYRAGKAVKSCIEMERRYSCRLCGDNTLIPYHVENGIENRYVRIHL